MPDGFDPFRAATRRAILQPGASTPADLRAAVAAGQPPPELATLVDTIRTRPFAVLDADLDALRERFSEDQLFEIIVAAAFGAAEERLAAARRALAEA
jgi:hypothetical protein